ncbi:MAG: aminotransferase class I/II-fold pyridoxal phosphate-dependent enzyme, partial [Phycisphaerae bacterium]|nr:aminotransferase class I/II-fold pyridoxal phosphate-dependent enzyme [Phycisphaerae bacterium]
NAIEGVSCTEPTGAFYCFPDISARYGKVSGSLDFAGVCLEQARVALVPGIAFGEDRCVRLSFATSLEQIDKGIDRLEEMIRQG